jgi:hypothetical protein
MCRPILPIEERAAFAPGRPHTGDPIMGKGNHSQKNDKKKMKPKQDKAKPAVKK